MTTWATRPLLFGHRGARTRCPENTIPSFLAAIEDGANALELDVHVTRDGVVVVMHDDDGERMCGVRRAVKDCLYEEVKGWDAGSSFVSADGARGFANRGLQVPTLEQVLRAVPGVPVNIDLKPSDPGCAAFVVNEVKRLKVEERVLLTSFHDGVLAQVRRCFDGRVGASQRDSLLLRGTPLFLLRRRKPRVDRLQIPPRVGSRLDLSSREFIDKMHALDIKIDYWVINETTHGRQLLDAGADGLMTDVPLVLAPLLR